MNKQIEKALDEAFAGFDGPPYLDDIKADMAETLEDRIAALRKKGVVEEAALKKVLGDFAKNISLAQSFARGNKKKYLTHLARSLELSPLGRKLGIIWLAGKIMAVFGALTIGIIGITGGSPANMLGGAAFFFAPASGIFLYIKLIQSETSKQDNGYILVRWLAILVGMAVGAGMGFIALLLSKL